MLSSPSVCLSVCLIRHLAKLLHTLMANKQIGKFCRAVCLLTGRLFPFIDWALELLPGRPLSTLPPADGPRAAAKTPVRPPSPRTPGTAADGQNNSAAVDPSASQLPSHARGSSDGGPTGQPAGDPSAVRTEDKPEPPVTANGVSSSVPPILSSPSPFPSLAAIGPVLSQLLQILAIVLKQKVPDFLLRLPDDEVNPVVERFEGLRQAFIGYILCCGLPVRLREHFALVRGPLEAQAQSQSPLPQFLKSSGQLLKILTGMTDLCRLAEPALPHLYVYMC